MYDNLKKTDPEIYGCIAQELQRQKKTLGLIASENFASLAVLEALANPMNNKYAEGYPKRRYYAGNTIIDDVEIIAIERAKKLFKAEHANVQPHSGASANMAVYLAMLNPGDKIMALELAHGGHLTHGANVNFSGKWYRFVHYHLDKETHYLDFDEIRKLALHERPKAILCGYTAYPRTVEFDKFAEIAKEVGAFLIADVAHIAGLICGGAHPNPFPYADVVSTTTHKTLRGPRGAMILSQEKWAKAIDKAVFPGLQGGPLEHVIAAKAVCFKEALSKEFADYAHQIVKNAKVLADEFLSLGYSLVTGGTDNHMIILDLTKTGLNIWGRDAQEKLDSVGIVCNKNLVPYDTRSPVDPSGLRLGTPALTTRGMKEEEMKVVANLVDRTLKSQSETEMERIRRDVEDLAMKFEIYKGYELN